MLTEITPQPLGRDEYNLSFFPIGIPGKNQPSASDGSVVDELTYSVIAYDLDLKEKVPKTLKIRTSSKHGFCTGYEIGILVGLLTLHHLTDQFATPELSFKNERLYELMKWTKGSGQNNTRLELGLDRLNGTELKFLNTWSVDGGKTFKKTFSTRILDSYEFVKTSDSEHLGRTKIRWSDKLYEQFSSGNVKPLNTDHFYSLSRPQAQAAYRIIDAELAHSDRFEVDMYEFAARIGIPMENRRRVKERVESILSDLDALPDFLSPSDDRLIGSRGNWSLNFRKPLTTEVSKAKAKPAAKRANVHPDAVTLIQAFHQRARKIENWQPTKNELTAASEDILACFSLETALSALDRAIKSWKRDKFQPYSFQGAVLSIKSECHLLQTEPSKKPNSKPAGSTAEATTAAASSRSSADRARTKRLIEQLSPERRQIAWQYVIEKANSESFRSKLEISRAANEPLPFIAYPDFRRWIHAHGTDDEKHHLKDDLL